MKVVSGAEVWRWHATHGVPLEISLPMLADKGLVPTWDALLDSARKDGANEKTLIRRLQSAALDAYGRDDGSVISERLALLGRLREH